MSGGVDSSATAVLLKERGEEIVGLSMQLWRDNGRCCSLDDLWDARRVATQLGIPYYVLNLEKDFENTVVAPFVETYLRGETPSPCILCNNYVKFHHLVDKAAGIGADRVATGHYARVRYDETLRTMAAASRKGPQKGSVLFSVRPYSGAAFKDIIPTRRTDKAGSARDRAARGLADVREGGIAGNLFRRRAIVCRLRRGIRQAKGTDPTSPWRDRVTKTARSSASIRGFTSTRSASGRDSSRPASRNTW